MTWWPWPWIHYLYFDLRIVDFWIYKVYLDLMTYDFDWDQYLPLVQEKFVNIFRNYWCKREFISVFTMLCEAYCFFFLLQRRALGMALEVDSSPQPTLQDKLVPLFLRKEHWELRERTAIGTILLLKLLLYFFSQFFK